MRIEEARECLHVTRNVMSTDASASFARRYWVRTTAPFTSESGARRRSRAFESPQHIGRRDRRIGRLAMSMAIGEYVSVHSQADTEQAELKRERVELRTNDEGQHRETGGDLRRSRARSIARQAGSHATDGARMPATNSASRRLSLRVRFRLH